MRHTLLKIDSVVNLLIGVLLLLSPAGVPQFLGLPPVDHHFYITILGAVIFGIGIALFIELHSGGGRARGLGLAGAIAINLCGGGVLLWWIVFKPFDLPMRGHVTLWTVAILVLGIGLIELISGSWR